MGMALLRGWPHVPQLGDTKGSRVGATEGLGRGPRRAKLGVLAPMGGAEHGLGTGCPPRSFTEGSLPTTVCTAPGARTLG